MSFSLPDDALARPDGKPSVTWLSWITQVHNIVTSIQQSGPTSERPTKMLWIGRTFFDVTINKPVYVSSVRPTVWRDAAGSIV